ncbi:hypothetical protein AAKU67_003965 [Oxalobacteraceae bacterium GrIS 2.11]
MHLARHVDALARHEVPAQFVDFGHRALEGVVAQQQVVRQLARSHGLDDGLDGTHRVARLFARGCPHCQPHLAGGGQLVLDRVLDFVGRTPDPVGAEPARVDHHHLNAQRLHFAPQGLGQALDRELGGVVLPQRRHAARFSRFDGCGDLIRLRHVALQHEDPVAYSLARSRAVTTVR